jgi:site-specific recombinase XerD
MIVEVKARNMKGREHGRAIDLTEQARAACMTWWTTLRTFSSSVSTSFWASHYKGQCYPICTFTVQTIMKDAARVACIAKRVSTHTMRKTFASKVWIATDRDIRKTQIALGHESMNSTVSYLLGCESEVRTIIQGLTFGKGEPDGPEQQYLNLFPFPYEKTAR